jgi:Arc/MetJ-type ribon-helix-helix transcriptional regulator
MKYPERTALRLSQEQRMQIDALLGEGKFKSLSEIARLALQKFLDQEC